MPLSVLQLSTNCLRMCTACADAAVGERDPRHQPAIADRLDSALQPNARAVPEQLRRRDPGLQPVRLIALRRVDAVYTHSLVSADAGAVRAERVAVVHLADGADLRRRIRIGWRRGAAVAVASRARRAFQIGTRVPARNTRACRSGTESRKAGAVRVGSARGGPPGQSSDLWRLVHHETGTVLPALQAGVDSGFRSSSGSRQHIRTNAAKILR